MASGFTWKLVRNDLPQIAATLSAKVGITVKHAADIILEDVKANAPVDTGKLRDTYYSVQTGPDTAEVRSGDDTLYAGFVEFGTSRMRAQPHFVPAFDDAARLGHLINAAKQAGIFQP